MVRGILMARYNKLIACVIGIALLHVNNNGFDVANAGIYTDLVMELGTVFSVWFVANKA
jgi:hypothetical protein